MSKLALFDMDGTLVDYDNQLVRDLNKIRSPFEPKVDLFNCEDSSYIEARRQMITSQTGWFFNLNPYEPGWDILRLVQNLGYKIVILTKGPKSKPQAWSEKLQWYNKHLASEAEGLTITHDKSLVDGDILVDDWPEYIEAWLSTHPNGHVFMPENARNKGFTRSNVTPYDGTDSGLIRISVVLNSLERK